MKIIKIILNISIFLISYNNNLFALNDNFLERISGVWQIKDISKKHKRANLIKISYLKNEGVLSLKYDNRPVIKIDLNDPEKPYETKTRDFEDKFAFISIKKFEIEGNKLKIINKWHSDNSKDSTTDNWQSKGTEFLYLNSNGELIEQREGITYLNKNGVSKDSARWNTTTIYVKQQ